MRSLLLLFLGVPIPIIILVATFPPGDRAKAFIINGLLVNLSNLH
jgi:hypothetical protein